MTENKRFENRLNKENVKFNTQNPVWDNKREDALNVFEMIEELNALHEENQSLKKQIGNLEHTRDFLGDVCADCDRLEKENKKLKIKNDLLSDELEQAKAVINKKWSEYLKKKME